MRFSSTIKNSSIETTIRQTKPSSRILLAALLAAATGACELQNPILRFPSDALDGDGNAVSDTSDSQAIPDGTEDATRSPDAENRDSTTANDTIAIDAVIATDIPADISDGATSDTILVDAGVLPSDTPTETDTGIDTGTPDTSTMLDVPTLIDAPVVIDMPSAIDMPTAVDMPAVIDVPVLTDEPIATDIPPETATDAGTIFTDVPVDNGELAANGCRVTDIVDPEGRSICDSSGCHIPAMTVTRYALLAFGSTVPTNVTALGYVTEPAGARNVRGIFVEPRDVTTITLTPPGAISIMFTAPLVSGSTSGLRGINLTTNRGPRMCGDALVTVR